MKALKRRRRRDQLTDQWIDLEPVEKLRCDACGAWEGPKTPIVPRQGFLKKPLDLCPSCSYKNSNLKPL